MPDLNTTETPAVDLCTLRARARDSQMIQLKFSVGAVDETAYRTRHGSTQSAHTIIIITKTKKCYHSKFSVSCHVTNVH